MNALVLLTVYCVLIVVVSVAGGRLSALVRMTHLRTQILMSGVGGLMLGIAMLHLLPHATIRIHEMYRLDSLRIRFYRKFNQGIRKEICMKDKLNIYDKIISPLITEKSTNMSDQNKIIFKVPSGANKINLKKNIERIFKVNVTKINIINKKTRFKITRGRKIKKSGFKKAIITLKKGQNIDLTSGI